MRTLVIGDVHGCLRALQTALKAADYDDSQDQLLFLGDLIDRGPQSKAVLNFVLTQPDARSLKGNHEIMMLNARHSTKETAYWEMCGGFQTMVSYGTPTASWPDLVPDEHWVFIESCPDYIEEEDVIFAHATPDPDADMDRQDEYHLQWKKLDSSYPGHKSGKLMICGHSSQPSGEILDLGDTICLDTFVYGEQWLTVLDLESGRWYKGNENGESGFGRLPRNRLEARQGWGSGQETQNQP